MAYAETEVKGPPIFRFRASLQQRIASMVTPALFGESSTERRSSRFRALPQTLCLRSAESRPCCPSARERNRSGRYEYLGLQGSIQDRLHRLRFGNFFGPQPALVEHVQKIRVAARVQLIGPVDFDAPVDEKLRQGPVQDGGPQLGFDVIADRREFPARQTAAPIPGRKR